MTSATSPDRPSTGVGHQSTPPDSTAPAPQAPPDRQRERQLRLALWVLALALGIVHLWANRLSMLDGDGISYLDLADAYFRRDWANAVNGYWSPLYPWLLGTAIWLLEPTPDREFLVVQLVNVVVYAGALACLDFLLRQILDHPQARATEPDGAPADGRWVTLPRWALLLLGYAVFLLSAIYWVPIWFPSPDIALAAFTFLAVGLLLRIRARGATWPRYLVLGLVLGLGYLTKAVMFPLGIVLLALAVIAAGSWRRGVPRALAALLVFLAVAAPLVVAISARQGHLTFGETGRLNFLWYVNQVPLPLWTGEPPGFGTPVHPMRLIADAPRIYEFATPVSGSYPPWYDPSYWYAGATPRVEPVALVKRLLRSGLFYANFIFSGPQAGLLVGLLTLFATGRGRGAVTDVARQWPLWGAALAGLGAYALVHVEPRLIGTFAVLLWLALLAAVRLPDGPQARRLLASASIVMAGAMLLPAALYTARAPSRGAPPGYDVPTHWAVATELQRIGLRQGDRVAVVGDGATAMRWARLGRLRIVAELPQSDQARFWATTPPERERLFALLAATGAKAVVAERAPMASAAAGWHRLGSTGRYAHLLTDSLAVAR